MLKEWRPSKKTWNGLYPDDQKKKTQMTQKEIEREKLRGSKIPDTILGMLDSADTGAVFPLQGP